MKPDSLSHRERVLTALRHEEPDRVPIDLGGMRSTGIMGIAYNRLKEYLGIKGGRTRIYDVGQQLAKPELEVLETIGADVLPVPMHEPRSWWAGRLPDGSPCEYPDYFKPETLPDGSKVIRDEEGRIVSKMPKGGYYFDGVYHPLENVETIEELDDYNFYTPVCEEELESLRSRVKRLYEETDYALMLNDAGGIYEWAQGLRGWSNFLMDLIRNPEFAGALLDKLVDARIERLKEVLPIVDGYVQIVQVGDDLGTQNGPQIPPGVYREVVKPRHARFFRYIKEHVEAYLFIHTCGSVYDFIPDLIEMGVDILNPVQVSAKGMDTARLKEEFGDKITFWGGGCDTQSVLPFGRPRDVEDEVKRRIGDLAPGGGFIFTQVHNIQAGVPPENIMAMYRAAKEYGKYPIRI